MITRVLVLPVLLVGAILVAAPSTACAQDRSGAARPLSSFGLEVFRHVASTAHEPNVVFSPLSVGLAIALLTEGAEKATRTELQTALGTDAERWPTYQADIRALLTSLNADTTAITRIASAIFADEGRRLSREFVASAEGPHAATVRTLDLQARATPDVINAWASRQTDGRITEVMPALRRDLALVLLNAVYFKGMWEYPFDSAGTKPAPFVRAPGDTIPVPTMTGTRYLGHFEHAGARGLRIPYRGDRYAAYIVVPRSGSVRDVVSRLTVADVDGWQSRARGNLTKLYLPRLEHRGKWPLLEALAKAGVTRAVGRDAELGAMWETRQEGPTRVSEASQSTFLKIDEQGTEAAAVTSMGVTVTSVPPPPIEFRVDAPFLFVIRDESSGALMFVARIGDPLESGAR